MKTEYQQKISQLSDEIRKTRRTIVLTGAGISTESGIPDFRSPGTGLWEKMDPMAEMSRRALEKNPQKFYQAGFSLFLPVFSAQPNPAHKVLAWMEEKGLIDGIITQNIDGLHQKAGSERVWEVHGHLRSGFCMNCEDEYPMAHLQAAVSRNQVPRCECGGTIRPNVILFGDSMPSDFWQSAEVARSSELLLVIGSSLEVSPVNALPGQVKRVVIINLGPTSYDYRANLVIREKASQVMADLKECLKSG